MSFFSHSHTYKMKTRLAMLYQKSTRTKKRLTTSYTH